MLELRRNREFKVGILSILLIMAISNTLIVNQSTTNQEQSINVKNYYTNSSSNSTAFISVWDTTKLSSGSSSNNKVRLPLQQGGTYNFTVDWGDKSNDTITTWDQPGVVHNYIFIGNYTVKINGTLIGWRFNAHGDRLKIFDIQHWGCLQLGNSGGYFYGCSNLRITANDILNVTGTTDLSACFKGCNSLGSIGNMNNWDVSNVINMSEMFSGAVLFNQPIGAWNVTHVTNMKNMFYAAYAFNQPIGNWNVSSVTTMEGMFLGASSFDQAIGNWNVSKVTNMEGMFCLTSSFNHPIGSWNVSSVTDMNSIFTEATSFNQPIGNWDVSKVTDIAYIFYRASSFNQPIGNWTLSSLTNMGAMFMEASSFNQPIGDWDVSKVTTMNMMFSRASSFNQPIGNWTLSSLTTMY